MANLPSILDERECDIHLQKDKSRTRTSGSEFEYKLAGLLYLRAKAVPGLRFIIATNVEGANPADDVVLRLWWDENGVERTVTYFIQLKHCEKEKHINTEAFLGDGGDFSLKKYLQCYKNFYKNTQERNDGGPNSEFLYNYRWEDVRFVIYTNKSADHCKTNEQDFRATFPFSDIFITANNGDVFCFCEEDKKVWGLYDDSVDCTLYKDIFLPRLCVVSRQRHVSMMSSLIEEELLKGKNCKGDTLLVVQSCYLKYVQFLHKWWNSDFVSCLSQSTFVIETLVKEEIEMSERETEMYFPLVFTDLACEEVTRKISEVDVLHIVVPGIATHLRCAKIKQALALQNARKYVVLDNKHFSMYPCEILTSMCLNLCDIVVLNIGSSCEQIVRLMSRVQPYKKMILVIDSLDNVPTIVSLLTNKTYSEWVDVWSFCHVTPGCKAHFNKCIVSFQNRSVTISDLEIVWPGIVYHISGHTINALINTFQVVKFGGPLPCHDTFYLPRIVEHPAELLPEIFKENCETDHIVVSGITRSCLKEKFGVADCDNVTFLSDSTTRNDAGNSFRNVSANKVNCNIHNVSYRNNRFIWNETSGNPSKLFNFIDKKNIECGENPVCAHSGDVRAFASWKDRVILITGDPGLGKSTFLIELANELKNNNPTCWVILMAMKKLESYLHRLSCISNISFVDVMDLLSVASGISNTEHENTTKEFLRQSVSETDNAIVIVDGVDEVCPSYKEKAIHILKVLLESHVRQVWIASRVFLEEDLGCALNTIPLHLVPFSHAEQQKYLTSYWSHELNIENEDSLEKIADSVLEKIRKVTDHASRSICDIPLHVYMVAEVHKTYVEDIIKRNNDSTKNMTVKLVKLFRNFVEIKRNIFWKKCGVSREFLMNTPLLDVEERLFEEIHTNCAVVSLFKGESVKGLHIDSCNAFIEKNIGLLEKENTGIIKLFVDGKPVFIHQMFAEYFAAMWLKQNIKANKGFLEREFWKENFKVLRYFFDLMLAEDCSVHEAVLSGDTKTLDDILPTNAISCVDNGGRLALHLAACYGRTQALQYLINSRSDLQAQDSVYGWTALRYADAVCDVSAAEQLMQHGGCREDIPTISTSIQNFVLWYLCAQVCPRKAELVEFLREVGAIVNSAAGNDFIWPLHEDRYLPLQAIALVSEEDVFKNVLKVSLKEVDVKNRPLYFAVGNSDIRILFTFLRREVYTPKNRFLSRQYSHYWGNALVYSSPFSVHRSQWDVRPILKDELMDPLFFMLIQVGKNANNQYPKRTLLHHAASDADPGVYDALLNLGMDPNAEDECGNTPLHVLAGKTFVGNGYVCCHLLLDKGADCSRKNVSERTPIFHIAFTDDLGPEKESINLNEVYVVYGPGWDTETDEERARRAELFLNAGAECCVRDKFGKTPLHIGVEKGYKKFCEVLLIWGCDPNAKDNQGATTLHLAARYGKENVMSMLLDREVSIDERDCWGHTPLYYSVNFGYAKETILLLNTGAKCKGRYDDRATLLHFACQTGIPEIVETLVAQGLNVNERDNWGLTPLHYLARGFLDWSRRLDVLLRRPSRHAEVLDSLEDHLRTSVFYFLVSRGANGQLVDNYRRSLLHYAARRCTYMFLAAIIPNVVDVNMRDALGLTALNIASTYGNNHAVRVLLDNDANMEIGCNKEKKPLLNAAKFGHWIVVRDLLHNKANKNGVDVARRTPLIVAAEGGHEHVVSLLLEYEADVNKVDRLGKNCLHEAARNGNVAIVEMLLKTDIDVNKADKRGFTPLHLAVAGNHEQAVKCLLDRGKSFIAVTRNEMTVLQLAKTDEMRRVLREAGFEDRVNTIDSAGTETETTAQNEMASGHSRRRRRNRGRRKYK